MSQANKLQARRQIRNQTDRKWEAQNFKIGYKEAQIGKAHCITDG